MKPKFGFTLIEMLVVIAIIGLLSAISIANFRRGEESKAVTIANDTVTNAIRNAQSFALASQQIEASTCSLGKAPQSYLIDFTSAQLMSLYGVDKCNVANLIESYANPADTEFTSHGYQLNGSSVANLQIEFSLPFGSMTASTSSTANSGPFSAFTTATFNVQSTDGAFLQTVTVDGVSGRIGE